MENKKRISKKVQKMGILVGLVLAYNLYANNKNYNVTNTYRFQAMEKSGFPGNNEDNNAFPINKAENKNTIYNEKINALKNIFDEFKGKKFAISQQVYNRVFYQNPSQNKDKIWESYFKSTFEITQELQKANDFEQLKKVVELEEYLYQNYQNNLQKEIDKDKIDLKRNLVILDFYQKIWNKVFVYYVDAIKNNNIELSEETLKKPVTKLKNIGEQMDSFVKGTLLADETKVQFVILTTFEGTILQLYEDAINVIDDVVGVKPIEDVKLKELKQKSVKLLFAQKYLRDPVLKMLRDDGKLTDEKYYKLIASFEKSKKEINAILNDETRTTKEKKKEMKNLIKNNDLLFSKILDDLEYIEQEENSDSDFVIEGFAKTIKDEVNEDIKAGEEQVKQNLNEFEKDNIYAREVNEVLINSFKRDYDNRAYKFQREIIKKLSNDNISKLKDAQDKGVDLLKKLKNEITKMREEFKQEKNQVIENIIALRGVVKDYKKSKQMLKNLIKTQKMHLGGFFNQRKQDADKLFNDYEMKLIDIKKADKIDDQKFKELKSIIDNSKKDFENFLKDMQRFVDGKFKKPKDFIKDDQSDLNYNDNEEQYINMEQVQEEILTKEMKLTKNFQVNFENELRKCMQKKQYDDYDSFFNELQNLIDFNIKTQRDKKFRINNPQALQKMENNINKAQNTIKELLAKKLEKISKNLGLDENEREELQNEVEKILDNLRKDNGEIIKALSMNDFNEDLTSDAGKELKNLNIEKPQPVFKTLLEYAQGVLLEIKEKYKTINSEEKWKEKQKSVMQQIYAIFAKYSETYELIDEFQDKIFSEINEVLENFKERCEIKLKNKMKKLENESQPAAPSNFVKDLGDLVLLRVKEEYDKIKNEQNQEKVLQAVQNIEAAKTDIDGKINQKIKKPRLTIEDEEELENDIHQILTNLATQNNELLDVDPQNYSDMKQIIENFEVSRKIERFKEKALKKGNVSLDWVPEYVQIGLKDIAVKNGLNKKELEEDVKQWWELEKEKVIKKTNELIADKDFEEYAEGKVLNEEILFKLNTFFEELTEKVQVKLKENIKAKKQTQGKQMDDTEFVQFFLNYFEKQKKPIEKILKKQDKNSLLTQAKEKIIEYTKIQIEDILDDCILYLKAMEKGAEQFGGGPKRFLSNEMIVVIQSIIDDLIRNMNKTITTIPVNLGEGQNFLNYCKTIIEVFYKTQQDRLKRRFMAEKIMSKFEKSYKEGQAKILEKLKEGAKKDKKKIVDMLDNYMLELHQIANKMIKTKAKGIGEKENKEFTISDIAATHQEYFSLINLKISNLNTEKLIKPKKEKKNKEKEKEEIVTNNQLSEKNKTLLNKIEEKRKTILSKIKDFNKKSNVKGRLDEINTQIYKLINKFNSQKDASAKEEMQKHIKNQFKLILKELEAIEQEKEKEKQPKHQILEFNQLEVLAQSINSYEAYIEKESEQIFKQFSKINNNNQEELFKDPLYTLYLQEINDIYETLGLLKEQLKGMEEGSVDFKDLCKTIEKRLQKLRQEHEKFMVENIQKYMYKSSVKKK